MFPLFANQPPPISKQFLYDSVKALNLCHNLSDFRLGINMEAQVRAFSQLSPAIHSLHVEHGSWCLMNYFPIWMAKLSPTLKHLSINLTSEVNADILEQSLKELPNLRGLHVANCMKLDHHDVLRLVRHTPLLESLSLTTWEHPSTDANAHAELRNLRHLVLDTRNVISTLSLTPLWSGIIEVTKRSNAPLSSLTLQLSERKGPDPEFIEELLDAHANTLTELRFKNCNVTFESLIQICQRCHDLEVLQIPINLKILGSFVEALEHSKSLKVLVDDRAKHSTESIAPSLKLENAKLLMTRIPSLRTIESETKRWSAVKDSSSLQITLERMKPGFQRTHQLHRFS